MPLAPNVNVPVIAFIEGSVALILLVLYSLLARGFPARYLRYWMAGWAAYAVCGAGQAVSFWGGGRGAHALTQELSFGAAVCFCAAILDLTGRRRWLGYLWRGGAAGAIVLAVGWWKGGQPADWAEALLESGLCFAAGWMLWKSPRRGMGFGASLLAAALLLRGLHGLDRADWASQALYPLRLSFGGLLDVAAGVAMAVLVLEVQRTRAEDLNEKLRRLAMITAATAQSLSVEEVLGEVLDHVVESLGADEGLVRLLEEREGRAEMVLRAAVGLSSGALRESAVVQAGEPWVQRVLDLSLPLVCHAGSPDPGIRAWMESEGLATLVLIRLAGKDAAVGLLGIGSREMRDYEKDEVHFLVNVANLLGLTIQNVGLFEKVKRAESQWVNTFDSIGDLIFVHDAQGRIRSSNSAFARRLGSDVASLPGRLVRDVLPRDGGRWSACPYCEGAGGKAEAPDPRLGGYLLATNSDFSNAEGKKSGTVHVLKDISERRAAETKFRSLFENMREGVFLTGSDRHLLDCNDAFVRLLGYEKREELLDASALPDYYVEAAERDRLFELLRSHGEVTNFEFRLRRRDGEIRTVSETSFATRNASGGLSAYQGFLLDVTEGKRAERELRRRNRELMALNSIAQMLGQSLDMEDALEGVLNKVVRLFSADIGAIYLLDQASGIVRRAAAFGWRSEYARVFPPAALPADLLRQMYQVRATLLSTLGLQLPEAWKDVHEKEGIQVSHLVVLWAGDRIIGGLNVSYRAMREFSGAELNLLAAVGSQIATAIDKSLLLDQTRQAYEELRRTQEQLLQSEKMAAVGQLISGVTHELNNPLTAILGYSQLLESEGHVDARGAEYAEKLRKQAQRAHRIVQNLLSFARQHKPERLPVQINEILEDTFFLREYDFKLNNIRIHRELDPDLPVTAADAHQLQQVFLNILNNAFDAVLEHGGDGDIWVRTRAAGGFVAVEFTDSGPGVRDPLRVFDPFYTTKPVGRGTGLGLSICYGIVKEHGGEIQVRNAVPRGASFTVTLPLHQELVEAARGGSTRDATALKR
ncbi:MAG TPA: ATP-binding protein [Candidatus Acidoferrales bacterium]|nr:ATP-binding protein [Candidatus Acidoferrales bacterium]